MNCLTIIATCASAASAIASMIGIFINIHYSRKSYRASLERKSKLDLLQCIRVLVPKYVASVDYALFLYIKASADENDKAEDKEKRLSPGIKYENTTFDDYSRQLNEAKSIFYDLKNNLSVYKEENLKKDIEAVWHVLDQDRLNKISSNATNGGISVQEHDANDYMDEHSKVLIDHFDSWYETEFNKLIK